MPASAGIQVVTRGKTAVVTRQGMDAGFRWGDGMQDQNRLWLFVRRLQRTNHFARQHLDLLMPFFERSAWTHDKFGGAGLGVLFDPLPHMFWPAQRREIERR